MPPQLVHVRARLIGWASVRGLSRPGAAIFAPHFMQNLSDGIPAVPHDAHTQPVRRNLAMPEPRAGARSWPEPGCCGGLATPAVAAAADWARPPSYRCLASGPESRSCLIDRASSRSSLDLSGAVTASAAARRPSNSTAAAISVSEAAAVSESSEYQSRPETAGLKVFMVHHHSIVMSRTAASAASSAACRGPSWNPSERLMVVLAAAPVLTSVAVTRRMASRSSPMVTTTS